MSYYHAWRWYEDSRDNRRWSHLALILNTLNAAIFAHHLSFAKAFKYIKLLFMTSLILSLKKTNQTAIKSIDKSQTCFLIKTSLDNNIAVIIVPSSASPFWYNVSLEFGMTASISAQLDMSETEGWSSHYKLPAVFTSSFVLFESCNTVTKFHYTDKMQWGCTVVDDASDINHFPCSFITSSQLNIIQWFNSVDIIKMDVSYTIIQSFLNYY